MKDDLMLWFFLGNVKEHSHLFGAKNAHSQKQITVSFKKGMPSSQLYPKLLQRVYDFISF
jgi:hypothetical protein